ncbi:hypothetical protein VE03_05284, partial [Pseudogymnoascus sp. 23342-1-I1]
MRAATGQSATWNAATAARVSTDCKHGPKVLPITDALKRHEKVHAEPKRSLLGKGERACLACAASRRKCSGDTPCSACERRSLACEFPPAGKRRRGTLGTSVEAASDGFGAEEDVVTSPRVSLMSWSNAPQSPAAAGDLTYQPELSEQAGEKRPPCSRCKGSRCKGRRLTCEYGTTQPRKSRSQSPALIQHDGYEQYPNDEWMTQDEFVFDVQGFEELETTSPYSSNSNVLGDTGLPVWDDATDIARSPSLSAHGGSLTRSRVNSPVMAWPTIPPNLLEFSVPAFMEFSEKRNRRSLVGYFCSVFSHLVVFSEDPGNPFQQLILPLAHRGSPVMNAIYALSSAHLETRGVHTEEKSSYFHNEATRGLSRLIDQNEGLSTEEVLCAILLLIYYEALVQRDSYNMVTGHLKGAMTVMTSYSQSSSPTSMFLQRAFRYYDVITALSFGTAPISSTSTPLLPLNILGSAYRSPHNDVDSLLGMTTDFWHVIHRLSLLCELKGEIQKAEARSDSVKVLVLRTELECTSDAIETFLTQWKPSVQRPSQPSKPAPPPTTETSLALATASSSQPVHSPPPGSSGWEYDLSSPSNATSCDLTDPDAHIWSIINNAEAYRQAALVFLYRNIHTLSRSHPKVQKHVYLSLAACVRVVGWAGPMPALLWPMFISSVEAISEEDRGVATMAFEGTERRQGMLNIRRAWEIVEEVWRRGDEGEEHLTFHTLSLTTADLPVLSSLLLASPTGTHRIRALRSLEINFLRERPPFLTPAKHDDEIEDLQRRADEAFSRATRELFKLLRGCGVRLGGGGRRGGRHSFRLTLGTEYFPNEVFVSVSPLPVEEIVLRSPSPVEEIMSRSPSPIEENVPLPPPAEEIIPPPDAPVPHQARHSALTPWARHPPSPSPEPTHRRPRIDVRYIGDEEELPELGLVSEVVVCEGHKIHPSTLLLLLSRLRGVHRFGGTIAEEHWDVRVTREGRKVLAEALIRLPRSITHFTPHFRSAELDPTTTHSLLLDPLRDHLSLSIRFLSRRFRKLHLENFRLSSAIFDGDGGGSYPDWSGLEEVHISYPVISSDGQHFATIPPPDPSTQDDPDDYDPFNHSHRVYYTLPNAPPLNELYAAAGRARQHMPVLKSLKLTLGIDKGTHEFVYGYDYQVKRTGVFLESSVAFEF